MRQEAEEIVLEVPGHHAFEGLFAGLFGGVGDVDLPGYAPLAPIRGAAGHARALLDGLPVGGESRDGDYVDAHGYVAALTGEDEGVGLRGHSRYADWGVRLLVWLDMERQTVLLDGLWHGEAPELVLVDAGRGVVPELEDEIEGVAGHGSVLAGLCVEAEDREVAGEAA